MKAAIASSIVIFVSAAIADYTLCALLGSYFPPPSSSSIRKANLADSFQAAFDKLVSDGGDETYGEIFPNTTSFSVIYFSGSSSDADEGGSSIFELQHTSPYDTAHGKSAVTADTRFPLGEVTMVFTVYAWLVKMGDHWSDPITKYLPELNTHGGDFEIPWDDITIGDLAGHASGLPRSCKYSRELKGDCGRSS